MLRSLVALTFVCSFWGAEAIPKHIPNYFSSSYLRAGGNSDSFVAFSAGLTSSTQLNSTANVTFDRVWTNYGNGYDATSGVFTCPTAGTYVFFYYAMAQSSSTLWLDLYQNDNYIATGYAHTTNDYANAGNVAVLTLNAIDDVYVRVRGNTSLYGLPDEIYCTFSGFLLYPEQQNSQGIIGK